jgi:hypothetical protein
MMDRGVGIHDRLDFRHLLVYVDGRCGEMESDQRSREKILLK